MNEEIRKPIHVAGILRVKVDGVRVECESAEPE
jgi:hypothetical protein